MNNNGNQKSEFTPLAWFLMGSGASLVLLLGSWGLWFFATANESSDFFNSSLTSGQNKAKVANQLRGHWDLETLNDEMPPSLFFTEDNRFAVRESESHGDEVGYYNIESDDQVNYLFLIDPDPEISNQFLIAIFDFPEQEKLRIDFFISDDPPTSRPSNPPDFSNESAVYKKVSTVISDDIDINPLEQQGARAMQVEAQQAIGAILRQQQAFYLERGRFSDSLQALRLGLPSETDNYSYTIVSVDPGRMVQVAAQSKKYFLKSYTGIVYSSGGRTQAIMCESDEKTTELPPNATFNRGRRLVCPDGYSEL